MIGTLRKLSTDHSHPPEVRYELRLGETHVSLNPLIGTKLSLKYTGRIFCQNCGKKIAKSFNQGYCYPCFSSLPETDMCMVKPEKCHFHLGTCRDPAWGKEHCFIPHTIYLANSSGLKVGITRSYHKLHRWMDQGATQAIAICEVQTRMHAGQIEVELSKQLADKTNWRKMLSGDSDLIDLVAAKKKILANISSDIPFTLADDHVFQFKFPVSRYPQKIVSLDLEKSPEITGLLWGIKGQYLIFDHGVINIRKFGGYEVEFSQKLS